MTTYSEIFKKMTKYAKAYYTIYEYDIVVVLCRIDATLNLPNVFQHISTK